MEDPTPVASVPYKRPLEADVEPPPISTPTKAIRSEASTPLSVLSYMKTPSPLQHATLHTTRLDSSASAVGNATPTPDPSASNDPQQPAKRRRLTQKEKEDQRLEKEAKAKARDEKKAQKEAEDKLRAEQKAQKEEEKQKVQKERDEKKRQKEEEQQQKEEEKAKKERSQMKLNAFFVKPKATSAIEGQAVVDSTPNSTAPPASLVPDTPGISANPVPPSPQTTIVKNAQSDYEKYFLPFSLPAHAILAPGNALMQDPAKLEAARTRLDSLIGQQDGCMEPITPMTLKASFPKYVRRGVRTASVAEIYDRVHGSSDQRIVFTDNKDTDSRQPLDMLKNIPMKYIHFGEDVRPPYYGTYTQAYTDREASRLARNPISRLRQDTNYDYDSEAEWDEPEEGEDLDSEGEDDVDEEGEDDMDGFLDDEEDAQARRRHISGDLVPVSTGLCWEDVHGVSRLNDGSDAICTDFREFKMEFLLQPQPHSIDPFSEAYWTPEPAAVKASLAAPGKDSTSSGVINPPRAPLAQRTMNGLLNTLNPTQTPPAGTASKPAKARRLIPDDQLPAFKAEVEGKDLTKIGMIEALKKAFPKLPKDAIANTLSTVAARVGPTEKEKRWVLISA